MKITGNEPAFPFWKWNEAGYGDAVVMRDNNGGMTVNEYCSGLTIRQHFASMAMQGYVASHTGECLPNPSDVARRSVEIADVLIAELNSKPNPNE